MKNPFYRISVSSIDLVRKKSICVKRKQLDSLVVQERLPLSCSQLRFHCIIKRQQIAKKRISVLQINNLFTNIINYHKITKINVGMDRRDTGKQGDRGAFDIARRGRVV